MSIDSNLYNNKCKQLKPQNIYNLLCCLFFCTLLCAQDYDDSNISRDSIISMLDHASALFEIKTNDKSNYELGVRLIDKGLLLAKDSNDPELLARAYTLKAILYLKTSNNKMAEKLISQAFNYEYLLLVGSKNRFFNSSYKTEPNSFVKSY